MTTKKSTTKQNGKLMDDNQSRKLLNTLEEQVKHASNGVNEQGEQIIQRQEVNNTPFVVITINNESFGTFGKYRITENYHTKQQCEAELKRMDWNRVIQVITLVIEMMKETNK